MTRRRIAQSVRYHAALWLLNLIQLPPSGHGCFMLEPSMRSNRKRLPFLGTAAQHVWKSASDTSSARAKTVAMKATAVVSLMVRNAPSRYVNPGSSIQVQLLSVTYTDCNWQPASTCVVKSADARR